VERFSRELNLFKFDGGPGPRILAENEK